MTIAQIAEHFGVSDSAIRNLKLAKPEPIEEPKHPLVAARCECPSPVVDGADPDVVTCVRCGHLTM
jgi:hypothetical protein